MTWRIIHSQKIANDFIDLCLRAESEGRIKSVLDGMRRVRQELAADPFAIGEPHNRLKHLDLLLCVVIRAPLVVHYAIDKKRRWVYLRQVQLLS